MRALIYIFSMHYKGLFLHKDTHTISNNVSTWQHIFHFICTSKIWSAKEKEDGKLWQPQERRRVRTHERIGTLCFFSSKGARSKLAPKYLRGAKCLRTKHRYSIAKANLFVYIPLLPPPTFCTLFFMRKYRVVLSPFTFHFPSENR